MIDRKQGYIDKAILPPLIQVLEVIEPITHVEICRDPDDDKFLGCAYGKGDRPKLRAIIKFLYTFQFCMSTAVALILGVLSKSLVATFMDEPAILAAGTAFLRWRLVGMPFISMVLVSTFAEQPLLFQ